MEYKFRDIEKKWQDRWDIDGIYRVPNTSDKPKYYVLDMFPYPSGAGLHVGHPLGYIASDIYARYKRLKGFNVLHPMGYDAFGLPAEQYAIEHGIQPAVSTEQNIKNFRAQLDKIGLCFDWSRQVKTSDPDYYKWTQWIFLQIFSSWYNRSTKKAEHILGLIEIFEKEGNKNYPIPNSQFQIPVSKADADHSTLALFTSDDWNGFDESIRQSILMEYRLAYCGYGEVNWCEALGTVLANDEVINGVSERGGYPVIKKKLRQWYLRITEYADRLLEGLERVEFSEAMKEMQTNWIGKSYGAEINFKIAGQPTANDVLRVYTTRPDTIFGVDFMVIAPEHELLEKITSTGQKNAVEEYITYVKSRSERERMAEKKITGCFTGANAINPFDGREIPIWVSEYVLAGYGTGAIMAVPCGDERDFKFAKYFDIPITNIIGKYFDGEVANPTKDAILENSGFLNGILMRDAIDVVMKKIEESGIGERKVNYKMRDAAFSRQRYWGEPFPIEWKNGIAYPLNENALPLELPHVESYKPGPEGEGPLANIPEWVSRHLETNTMPGYAGSSWYFLRYMDPHNDKEFCDRKASDYWGQVDLYIGGTEHAVGHLLYSRMWTKILYDLGHIGYDEPYRKLVNQGMIQGVSEMAIIQTSKNQNGKLKIDYISRNWKNQTISLLDNIKGSSQVFYSYDLLEELKENGIEFSTDYNFPVNSIHNNEVNIQEIIKQRPDLNEAIYVCKGGIWLYGEWKDQDGSEKNKFYTRSEVEKMSKSKLNVVSPDDIIEKFGADTFRMYEMFLGPVEQSKPWDTKGIEGVHRFLKKLWRLFFDEEKGRRWTEEKATEAESKILHKTIKKIEEDTERFSFNTAVSAFMIAVNELNDLKCHKKEILEPLLILLTAYAPHICEELWHELGNTKTIINAAFPKLEEKYLLESTKNYPIAINGKTRTALNIALDATQQQVEELILADDVVKKWLEGKSPKKIIYVKNKMINVVL